MTTATSRYRIWGGKGEIATGEAHFHKNDGQIVGRPYVRTRVVAALRRWVKVGYTAQHARECLARTVDNDEWLGSRNGYIVAAICRDAVSNLLSGGHL